jgi:fluoroquinolone transport system ATP-binding protein
MIEVAGLRFTYAGATTAAVDDISFEVLDGEIFGFLGPSGAGKSTTQKILIGLLREYSGRVAVFGGDLSRAGSDYHERIGVSFEHPTHYLKLTAAENLRYFASLFGGETEPPARLLEAVGLVDSADMRVGQFSKGMRNRLNLARALVNRPELLFLDEPTAGLDPVNAQRIRDLIADVRRAGATVFLTTHDMGTADQLCDRVAFIVEGKIPLIDSPRDLRLRHGRRTVRVEYTAEEGDELHATEFDLDNLGDNAEFAGLLRGGRVETLHTQEATLADVFIDVTGQSLA